MDRKVESLNDAIGIYISWAVRRIVNNHLNLLKLFILFVFLSVHRFPLIDSLINILDYLLDYLLDYGTA